MKPSRLLTAALFLVALPHCVVNGEIVGPKSHGATTESATVGKNDWNNGVPTSERASSGAAPSDTAAKKPSRKPERASNNDALPDTTGIKLSPNGLPYLTQAEATAFFSSLSPAMLSHVSEQSKIVWQATIADHTDMVSPNYYYFGKPDQVQFTSDYVSPLPKPDGERLALDANHLVTSGRVLSAEYPTLKKGTPGVVYRLQGKDMRDRTVRSVFATLDGAVYVTFDDLHAISFAPGAGPVSDWPTDVQNPFVPVAFSGLTSAKHKQAYDDATKPYDVCMEKVKIEFERVFEANDAANIQWQTRKNRENQIGAQQEKAISARCGKLGEQAHGVMLRASKEAALEQLAFRASLYAANRARFAKP
jgi:hypothetical protein